MTRCKGCKYRAMPHNGYLCDYAALTGHSRGGTVDDCTVRQPGKRKYKPQQITIVPSSSTPRTARLKSTGGRKVTMDETMARILYDMGQNDSQIARSIGVSATCIIKWRRRNRLEPNARPGRPEKEA